jgi:tRNA (mo5U34)-methyltransferase
MTDALETRISQCRWFYRYVLPSGLETASYGDTKLHEDRLRILWAQVDQHLGPDRSSLSAIDLGSHQGWFSYHLAAGSFRRVVGVDARPEHVAQAEMIRDLYGLVNLDFMYAEVTSPAVAQLEPAELVLMYGLLYHLEDPIGALRNAFRVTRRLLLIETQVANTNLTGAIDWGAHNNQIAVRGSFAVIDEPDLSNVETGVTGLALVPSIDVVLWLLQRIGFASASVVPTTVDAHEQLASRKRVVIAALR